MRCFKAPFIKMKNINGFTFIELLIIIIIIGILSGACAPLVRNSLDEATMEGFAKNLYYLSRYLQTKALHERRTYQLYIDRNASEIRTFYKENEEHKSATERIARKYAIPKSVSITLEPARNSGIYFYPDASTDKATMTILNRHGRKISIITKGISGEITIQ